MIGGKLDLFTSPQNIMIVSRDSFKDILQTTIHLVLDEIVSGDAEIHKASGKIDRKNKTLGTKR